MTSLYGRLQRYQRGSSREPLEDFLTEALADLMNRMPRPVAAALAAAWFFDDAALRSDWLVRSQAATELSWRTQVRINDRGHRPDLIAYADERPLLVIEIKLWASFQLHVGPTAPKTVDQDAINQLHTYGRWIWDVQRDWARDDPQPWRGAIALLTFGSEPPAGFLKQDDASYGKGSRRLVRWSAIYAGLKDAAQKLAGPSATGVAREAWVALAFEFCRFLEEKNMSTETMTSSDYAVAELYGATKARLALTFQRFAAAAKPFHTTLGKRTELTEYEHDDVDSLIWGYFDPKTELLPADLSCWVAWGFRFPNPANAYFRGAGLKDVPSVFVGWGDNNHQRYFEPPAGWSLARERAEMATTRAIADFAADDPEIRTTDMARWIVQSLEALETAIRAAHQDPALWRRTDAASQG